MLTIASIFSLFPCRAEVINQFPFARVLRSCEKLVHSVRPLDLAGFEENQKIILIENLLTKTGLRAADRGGLRQRAHAKLTPVAAVPGKYFRAVQIPPSALRRILASGIPYLDWRRPSEGLYVTDRIDMAFAHATLPDHGTYSRKFVGVIFSIQPPVSEHWRTGDKLRVRDIAPEWITGVQIVRAAYVEGTSDEPMVNLTENRGS